MLYLFQAIMKYFWLKLFYSKSSLQCNSVMTVNKRPNKHVPGSIYKDGTYPDRIFSFLKDNLMEESMGKVNPVLGLLDQMKNYTGFSGEQSRTDINDFIMLIKPDLDLLERLDQ